MRKFPGKLRPLGSPARIAATHRARRQWTTSRRPTSSGIASGSSGKKERLRQELAAYDRHGFTIDMVSRSRGAFRPSLAIEIPHPLIGGCRESRARAAPAVSCANWTSKNAHEHTGPAEASGFPCAVVSTGLYVLSPVTGFATVARAPEHELDTSVGVSGPHDFAVRLRRPRQERRPRPPLPRPALVTLRNAPPDGTGWPVI
jgi:hypothetical protein